MGIPVFVDLNEGTRGVATPVAFASEVLSRAKVNTTGSALAFL